MLKNITFSANSMLIDKARKKAASQKKPLNTVFREWLLQYVEESSKKEGYEKLMKLLDYVSAEKNSPGMI